MSRDSSRARRNINLAQFVAPGGRPPQTTSLPPSNEAHDVQMRSALSDDEEPPPPEIFKPSSAVASKRTERRRGFDTNSLVPKDGQSVFTYTPQASQSVAGDEPDDPGRTSALARPQEITQSSSTPTAPTLEDLPPMTSVDLGDLNSRSLEAVLVSSSFIKYHLRDLVWIKSRLIEHQAHILRCRNLTMKNLVAIERALYIEDKKGDLEGALGYGRESN